MLPELGSKAISLITSMESVLVVVVRDGIDLDYCGNLAVINRNKWIYEILRR